MLRFDPARLRAEVQSAESEDLLDRATVFREGLEPGAVEIIEDELRRRGIDAAAQTRHAAARAGECVPGPDGQPLRCQRCTRPAVWVGWTWHRLWGVLPVFPVWGARCAEHRPPDARPG